MDHKEIKTTPSEASSKSLPSQVIVLGSCSDCGTQREDNQDAYALPPVGVNEKDLGVLLVVTDGVGGRAEGRSASFDAAHYLQALYYAKSGATHLPERLRDCVEGVNALSQLWQRQHEQIGKHLTTLVAAVIQYETIWVANVGDSRAYLVTANGQFTQLTEDHSQEVQSRKSDLPRGITLPSNMITKAIGLTMDAQVDLYHYTWQPGNQLLLCTDGLNALCPQIMVETILLNTPQTAAQKLVAKANKVDGSDNSTVILASWQIASAPLTLPQQKRPLWQLVVALVLCVAIGISALLFL